MTATVETAEPTVEERAAAQEVRADVRWHDAAMEAGLRTERHGHMKRDAA